MPIFHETLDVVSRYVSGDLSDWSHSTIFSTDLSTYQTKDIPPLTTSWTPPTGCSNRWMAENIIAIGFAASISSKALPALRRATTDTDYSTETTIGTFVAFSTIPYYTDDGELYDRSYLSCQPYGAPNHYSPGICPHGQTVAEITEYHYSTTSGSTETRFEASCCQRYVTPEIPMVSRHADKTTI
jgi:hypothetical protein